MSYRKLASDLTADQRQTLERALREIRKRGWMLPAKRRQEMRWTAIIMRAYNQIGSANDAEPDCGVEL